MSRRTLRFGYHAAVEEKGGRRHCHARIGIVMCFAVGAGCMATAEHPQISLTYRAQAPVERVPGAENIKVNVIANDMRETKDWVCAGSGKRVQNARQAVGIIESVTPPAGLVGRAIKAELSHRGFDIDYKGIPVVANVGRFLCYRGDALSTIDATVGIDLLVYRAGRPPIGQEFFYRYIKGEYVDREKGIRWWNGENAKLALEAALADAMKQLFSDRRFIHVLLDPAVQAPPPAAKKSPPPPMPYTPN